MLPVRLATYRRVDLPCDTRSGDSERLFDYGPGRTRRWPRLRTSGRRRRRGTRGLPDCIGQSLEIVIIRGLRGGLALDAHHRPPPRDGQPIGVLGAQVVGMRLDERRQRTEHRRRFDVRVGEGGDGGRTARRPRAAPGHHRSDVSRACGPAMANGAARVAAAGSMGVDAPGCLVRCPHGSGSDPRAGGPAAFVTAAAAGCAAG